MNAYEILNYCELILTYGHNQYEKELKDYINKNRIGVCRENTKAKFVVRVTTTNDQFSMCYKRPQDADAVTAYIKSLNIQA